MITKGGHYSKLLQPTTSILVQKKDVTLTDYGFRITTITTFVTIVHTRLETYSNGTAKAIVKVHQNYRGKYQYSLYFDENGLEIIDSNQSTRMEAKYFRSLQSN